MKILILGHNGMLGNALYRYFAAENDIEVLTISSRYPNQRFLEEILIVNPAFIVNCIGAIPQKHPSKQEYTQLNEELPKSLDELGIPTLHPSTDCEFDGLLSSRLSYQKDHPRNAPDDYGQSKANISAWLEQHSRNTKIIRTSVIGHEVASSHSLLEWFLSQTGPIGGYTDQYWNGITTLEWAKQCNKIINNWHDSVVMTQLATPECVSKYELLCRFKSVYEKDIEINPSESGKPTNKCLASDKDLPSITDQLKELKAFYRK